jgi:predicted aminopeptidase
MGRKSVPITSPQIAGKLTAEEGKKLHWVPHVLDFARRELGLDPGDSYQTFLDTGGKPVTYAVTASHPLALIPYQWSFPFVGAVPYKGYFDREDAVAEATRLRNKGFEATVIPVSAFSTLGWFQDPVTSTMIAGSLADLIDTLIHETTHRTLYFAGASTFNESLATHVARQGTRLFLASRDDLRPLLADYEAGREAAREREDLLLRLHDDLDALYRSNLTTAEKLARKAEVFRTASAAAGRLHPGAPPLPASNASLLSIARYHEHEPLLRKLEEARGGRVADLVSYLKTLPAGEDPVAASEQEIARQGHPRA